MRFGELIEIFLNELHVLSKTFRPIVLRPLPIINVSRGVVQRQSHINRSHYREYLKK